jgi:cytochrome c556
MKTRAATVFAVALLGAWAAAADDASLGHRVSVREVMEAVITPATNTLWGVGNPQSEEDWRPYEQAAIAVIAAGTLIRTGGAGPDDAARASDQRWRDWSDAMTEAAVSALEAARARDLDAMIEATNVMYPPCEECHIAFHPGVE